MVTFTYDCRNRLIRAGDTAYEYDAENIRTAVETPEYREEYITDSVSDISRVLVITRQYKADSKTDTEKYYYGNGLIYEKSSEVGLLVYHYNHLGSTTAITDGEGKLVYSYDYGTYGELVSTTEYSNTTPIVRFLYNGQLGVATDDNGLYYMRSRYYNPDIKRFINQDVLIGSISNSNSLNRYSYVEGNPVSYTDPFGLSPYAYLNMFNPSVLIHTTLDVLGCLPGGTIFDIANAAIYFLEDNDTEGWKSLIFAIPGMDLAGKGMKWGAKIGGKGGKIVENTLKAIDFSGYLGSTFLSANDFGNDIAFMIDKYMVGEAEWSSDTAWELVSLAGHGFQLKSFSGSFMNNAKAGDYGSIIKTGTTDIELSKYFGEGSTFHYVMHDNSGNLDLNSLFGRGKNKEIPLELQQALEELDASGLRPGQTELHMSQLNKTLDQIQNNYVPTKAYSSVYSDGINRYLVEGHHTTVAFKMLGKGNAINMNVKTLDMPSVTNVYWSRKWYEFWKKTIRIVED